MGALCRSETLGQGRVSGSPSPSFRGLLPLRAAQTALTWESTPALTQPGEQARAQSPHPGHLPPQGGSTGRALCEPRAHAPEARLGWGSQEISPPDWGPGPINASEDPPLGVGSTSGGRGWENAGRQRRQEHLPVTLRDGALAKGVGTGPSSPQDTRKPSGHQASCRLGRQRLQQGPQ